MSAIPPKTNSHPASPAGASAAPSPQQQPTLPPQVAGDLARRRSPSGSSAPRTAFDGLARPPSLQSLAPETLEKILVSGLNFEDASRLFHTSRNCADLVKAAMSTNAYVLTASRSLSSKAGELPTIGWFDKFAAAYDSRTGVQNVQAFHAPMLDQDGNRLSAPDGSLRAVSSHEYILTQMIEAAMQWSQTLHSIMQFRSNRTLSDARKMEVIEVTNRVLDRLPDWIARLPVDAIAPLTASAMDLTLDAYKNSILRRQGDPALDSWVPQPEFDAPRDSRMKTLHSSALQALQAHKDTPQGRLGPAAIELHLAMSNPADEAMAREDEARALDAFGQRFRSANDVGTAGWVLAASNAVPRIDRSNYRQLFVLCSEMVSVMKPSALASAPPRVFEGLTKVYDNSLDNIALSALTTLLSKLPKGAPVTTHLAEEVPRLLAIKCNQFDLETVEGLLELSLDRTPESAPTGPDARVRLERQIEGLFNVLMMGTPHLDNELFDRGVKRFVCLTRRSTSLEATGHAANLAISVSQSNRAAAASTLMAGALDAIERDANQRPANKRVANASILVHLTLPTVSMDARTKLKACQVIEKIKESFPNDVEAGNWWVLTQLQSNLKNLSGEEPALG